MKLLQHENGETTILIDGEEHEISTVPTDETSGLYSVCQSELGSVASALILNKFLVKVLDVTGSKSEKSKVQLVGHNVVTQAKSHKPEAVVRSNKITAEFLEESDIE